MAGGFLATKLVNWPAKRTKRPGRPTTKVRGKPTNEHGAGPSAIVICGDAIGSRVLALLLRDSGYQARALPTTSSLNKPGALEGVQLLLLTPRSELSTERCKALLDSLKDVPGDAKLIVVELVTPSEERPEEEAREVAWHKVPWPCSISELEQRIEAALLTKGR